MGKKSQIIVFISFLLCGCLESEAKKAAADLLIDPDSAKFRNVRTVKNADGSFVCGEINGKNRMGAYSGYSSFIYQDRIKTALIASDKSDPAGEAEHRLDSLVDCLEAEWKQGTDDLWKACSAESKVFKDADAEAKMAELFQILWKNHCA